MKKIILKPGKEQSVKRYHPWIFSGAISRKESSLAEGDPVVVYSAQGELLGTGHYHSGSIAVRLIASAGDWPDNRLWKDRLERALMLRKRCGLAGSSHTNAYRLVNAEGDGMPGMIIDYYNGTAVMQAHTIGMHRVRDQVNAELHNVMGEGLKTVYYRGAKGLVKQSDKPDLAGYLFPPGGDAATNSPGSSGGGGDLCSAGNGAEGFVNVSRIDNIIKEYGNMFIVDWERGQKTGFFLDQRENRKLLEQYSGGKNVLNMFGYSGGFSVYALRGGAMKVVTVDSSAAAVEMAGKNVNLNFENDKRHVAVCDDVFDYFKNSNEKYDVVVADPPAFAKGTRAVKNALQAYRRLNSKAIEKVGKGGLLFTFSCSQVVSREQFRQAVYSAAILSGREIRILHQLSQPADHPVSIYHPEGEYLKGLVLHVF